MLSAFACVIRVFAGMGRLLLISIAISLITMPVTQHLWTWDHFLHGGNDFELTTLLALSFLGMALVLSRHFKQSLDSLFAALRFLSFMFRHRMQGRNLVDWAFSLFPRECLPNPPINTYSTPLQI
jgi:hypothetical protein